MCETQGAVPYNSSQTDISMANPTTGYFTPKASSGIRTDTAVAAGTEGRDAWYTTDCQRLEGLPTQRGIYVTNGKKVAW